ncbi:MAG: hypothetical protein ACK4K0_03340 [Flavobacteriales bacterium]
MCLSQDNDKKIKRKRVIFAKEVEGEKDSLKRTFGRNKDFIEQYELACLGALKHFPELKETKIKFRYKKLKTTLAARPTPLSVFGKKKNRTYLILINKYNPQVPLDSVNFNAQVGVLGHELAHILSYEKMSGWQIVKTGLSYQSLNYRRKMERETDLETLRRGLGWQILDYNRFAQNYKHATKKYLKYKKKIYLNAEEIEVTLSEEEPSSVTD